MKKNIISSKKKYEDLEHDGGDYSPPFIRLSNDNLPRLIQKKQINKYIL
jgi:hypothetical protein